MHHKHDLSTVAYKSQKKNENMQNHLSSMKIPMRIIWARAK